MFSEFSNWDLQNRYYFANSGSVDDAIHWANIKQSWDDLASFSEPQGLYLDPEDAARARLFAGTPASSEPEDQPGNARLP